MYGPSPDDVRFISGVAAGMAIVVVASAFAAGAWLF